MLKSILIFLLLSQSAYAHDWYPKDCCHNNDCAPIEQWIPGTNPGDPPTVVTKHGKAKLTLDQLRTARPSPDAQGHACLVYSWMMGSGESRNYVRGTCLWLPPSL